MLVAQLVVLRRYLKVLVKVFDRADEPAFSGITGNDHGAGIAASFPASLRVEQEAAFEFLRFGAVAFVAMLREQWADDLLEKLELARKRVPPEKRPSTTPRTRRLAPRNALRFSLDREWP